MKIIVKLIVNAIAVFLAAYMLDGVLIDSYMTALVVAIVLGLLNTFVKPLLVLFTLPITLLTLGLFIGILNVLMVFVAEALVPGFEFASIWWGVGFSILLSFISWFFDLLTRD